MESQAIFVKLDRVKQYMSKVLKTDVVASEPIETIGKSTGRPYRYVNFWDGDDNLLLSRVIVTKRGHNWYVVANNFENQVYYFSDIDAKIKVETALLLKDIATALLEDTAATDIAEVATKIKAKYEKK